MTTAEIRVVTNVVAKRMKSVFYHMYYMLLSLTKDILSVIHNYTKSDL